MTRGSYARLLARRPLGGGPTVDELSSHDSIELFLRRQAGPVVSREVVRRAGHGPGQPAPRTFLTDRRNDLELLKLPADVTVARKATPDGCVVEVLIPWKPLGVTPQWGRLSPSRSRLTTRKRATTTRPGPSSRARIPRRSCRMR